MQFLSMIQLLVAINLFSQQYLLYCVWSKLWKRNEGLFQDNWNKFAIPIYNIPVILFTYNLYEIVGYSLGS